MIIIIIIIIILCGNHGHSVLFNLIYLFIFWTGSNGNLGIIYFFFFFTMYHLTW